MKQGLCRDNMYILKRKENIIVIKLEQDAIKMERCDHF